MAEWQRDIGFYVATKGFSRPRSIDESDLMLSKLALIHSEVSEALEAVRHGKPDNFREEIADVVIRCLDMADACGFDLEEEIAKKMAYNETRPHKHGKRA